MGDIVLQCNFSTVPTALNGNLAIFLPVAVTNHVDANSVARDAVLLVDTGSGFVPTSTPGTVIGSGITFYGVNVPVATAGLVTLKITGVRVAATQVSSAAPQPVTANISFNVPLSQSQVVVAYARKSLYTTIYDTGITCYGSPVPSAISVTNLFAAGTALASTRFSEAFPGAFAPRGSGDDNGTRFLINYSGFPAGSQLFLPDFVAGSDAAAPTSGGDLGMRAALGQYLAGSGALMLARVVGSDSTGAGGQPMALPSGAPTYVFDTASPVTLTSGSGFAVYEVIAGNTSALESVQFPTFFGISNVTAAAVAQETVSYAPVTTALQASQTAPVPRFLSTTPTSDCSIVGDCQAGYFPKLAVATTAAFQQTVTAGANTTEIPGLIYIGNTGGGQLNWNININYQNGSNWILLDYPNGQGSATVRVWAKPQNLTAGTYTATLVVSGSGPQSTPVTIPITLTVQAPPPPTTTPTPDPTPTPTPSPAATSSVVVSAVVNAASLTASPLVPGSLGTVMGLNLSGKTVSVTFDGIPATLLYMSATQINLQVPSTLDAAKTSASLVVTADGVASVPVTVALAPAGPSVFNGAVLDQDYTPNAPAAPAAGGSVLQIFATGIPANAQVTAQIGGQGSLTPLYAGAAPSLTGVQQVNVAVPNGLATGPTPLTICATASGRQYCSSSYTIYLK